MVKARCIQKFRDKNNNIKGYLLEDCNGQQLRVTPEQIKMAIFAKQIEIVNLTLTKDGRLVDKDINSVTTNTTVLKDAKFEIFCNRMRQIPAMQFSSDEEAEAYANSSKATETIEYIIKSLSDLLGVKMQKFSFCKSYNNLNRTFTCSGLQFYLWFIQGKTDEYGWSIGYNGEGVGRDNGLKSIDACALYYTDNDRIHGYFEHVQELREIIASQPISYYDVALHIFETTSKFTDTKYATVGRYIVADDMIVGQEVDISQSIRYKMYKRNSGYSRDISIDAPLIDITLYPLDYDNQYTVDIKTSTDFQQYNGRNGEILISGDARYYGGELRSYIIGNSIEYQIDMHNKNWKKELKLVLEQEFKKAYHNLKTYLDRKGLLK